ncbi:MAG: hypothetical protein GX790_08750 [Syntrophomonadaceae bacterium]|nr:hypothetical protein [Syntrophomonadaceae bacterium]
MRKINKKEELSLSEYTELLNYIEKLRKESPDSYKVFFEKYAVILYQYYNTPIPKYVWDMDNLINFLINHPHICEEYKKFIPLSVFPKEARPYLLDTFGESGVIVSNLWSNVINPEVMRELPGPRKSDIIIKYEEANPYKEQGLKFHFDRLRRYSFISRLQTYRYLTRNKASFDRFEFISPDCLGGIFTNKEKSIYYYVFLTEANEVKAKNACQLLNYTFYKRIDG